MATLAKPAWLSEAAWTAFSELHEQMERYESAASGRSVPSEKGYKVAETTSSGKAPSTEPTLEKGVVWEALRLEDGENKVVVRAQGDTKEQTIHFNSLYGHMVQSPGFGRAKLDSTGKPKLIEALKTNSPDKAIVVIKEKLSKLLGRPVKDSDGNDDAMINAFLDKERDSLDGKTARQCIDAGEGQRVLKLIESIS
jgi:hypothetical protein